MNLSKKNKLIWLFGSDMQPYVLICKHVYTWSKNCPQIVYLKYPPSPLPSDISAASTLMTVEEQVVWFGLEWLWDQEENILWGFLLFAWDFTFSGDMFVHWLHHITRPSEHTFEL